MPNDDFDFPRTLANLNAVPAELRECYEPAEIGFQLTAEASDVLDEHERQVAKLEAKHAQELAALDDQRRAQNALIRDLLARTAIRDALDGLKVPQRLQAGAVALLCSSLKIEVDDPSEADAAPVLVVHDAYGLLSIENAVGRWLASDDGAGFRPAARPRPGEFGAMIEALKAPR